MRLPAGVVKQKQRRTEVFQRVALYFLDFPRSRPVPELQLEIEGGHMPRKYR
jgi:hypothetical protein